MLKQKRRTFFWGALLSLFVIGWIKGITCPFLVFLHIPCPTCGVTRAMISLLRADLSAYLHYNALALPLSASAIICFFRNRIGCRRVACYSVLSVLLINFIYYVFRLMLYFECGIFPPICAYAWPRAF